MLSHESLDPLRGTVLLDKIEALCSRSEAEGQLLLYPYCGYRDPWTQARLWRMSRTTQEIEACAARLLLEGFAKLGEILLEVGPQAGPLGHHVTHAGPGQSWHQYMLAVDVVPLHAPGRPIWDAAHPAWAQMGALARSVGLEWGGDWVGFRDLPHLQLDAHGPPLLALTREQIDQWIRRWRTELPASGRPT